MFSTFSKRIIASSRMVASARARSLSTSRIFRQGGAGSSAGALAGGLAVVMTAATLFNKEQVTPTACAAAPSKVPYTGLPGTDKERTFIAIKPDGVQRGLIAEIINRFERKGFKLVALKMVWPTKAKAESHYADLSKKPFFPGLVNYFSSGPLVTMVWEGKGVILTGRKLLGATNPAQSDVGTIRGDYALTVGRNICHGSDGAESAQAEIANWFTPEEVSDYVRSAEQWISADN